MTAPERDERIELIHASRRTARRAAVDLAIQHGSDQITRPVHPGARSTVRDVEPLAGLQAARELEQGARYTVKQYIKAARETGYSWRDIGAAMDLSPQVDVGPPRQTWAEAAFSYAAGPRDSDWTRRYELSFSWTCRSCEGLILDRGPFDSPTDAERGHAPGCIKLAAAIAEWEADWEAGA